MTSENIGCTCERCVKACQTRPCWGTPEDIKKLIDGGFGNKLMEDWWVEYPEDIIIISPACKGYEGCRAPEGGSFFMLSPSLFGSCVFLNKENLCDIHIQKPTEGREAFCCKSSGDDAYNLHEKVAMTWDSKEGHQVVKKWRKIIYGNSK